MTEHTKAALYCSECGTRLTDRELELEADLCDVCEGAYWDGLECPDEDYVEHEWLKGQR